jgi:hypothetical protein
MTGKLRKEKPRQDSQDRMPGKGHLGKDTQDRTSRTENL